LHYRFLVGAPRAEETPDEPAKIHRCSNIDFDDGSSSCSTMSPQTETGTLSGLSLNFTENQDIQVGFSI